MLWFSRNSFYHQYVLYLFLLQVNEGTILYKWHLLLVSLTSKTWATAHTLQVSIANLHAYPCASLTAGKLWPQSLHACTLSSWDKYRIYCRNLWTLNFLPFWKKNFTCIFCALYCARPPACTWVHARQAWEDWCSHVALCGLERCKWWGHELCAVYPAHPRWRLLSLMGSFAHARIRN